VKKEVVRMEKLKMAATIFHLPVNWVMVVVIGVAFLIAATMLGEVGTKKRSGKVVILLGAAAAVLIFWTPLGAHLFALLRR
jgi:hypothetical protein